MTRTTKLGIGAIVGLAIAAFLAFGVFGIHTAFIDDEVSEANPFANIDTDMALAFDDMEDQMASGEIVVEERVETTAAVAAMPDMPESDMADDAGDAAAEPADEEAAAPAVPEIRTIATNNGELVDHALTAEEQVGVRFGEGLEAAVRIAYFGGSGCRSWLRQRRAKRVGER